MTPPAPDAAAIARLLGGAETAWLVERVRARIPDADGAPLSGVVRLQHPRPEQREAVMRLVGASRRPAATLAVDLSVLEQVLRRGPWPAGLADAVQTLTGPVVDRRAERARTSREWDSAQDVLVPALERSPDLAGWWSAWCASGGLKRAARAEAARRGISTSAEVGAGLVESLVRVLEQIPASGEPLPVLARRVLGDAHALDSSRPLGRLTAAALRAQLLPGADAGISTREIWHAAGVLMSGLASTALCLGVPGATVLRPDADPLGAATSVMLESMRAVRAPVLLTLDQVRSGGIAPARTVVHVCENPTVIDVIARRWSAQIGRQEKDGQDLHPVMVCTSGQPSAAVIELLTGLTSAGSECRYHGDFDWAGLRIARFLSGAVPWTPWRFSAEDYLSAVEDQSLSLPLAGAPAESPWDPELADAMAGRGLAIEEEAVADLLAADVLPEG